MNKDLEKKKAIQCIRSFFAAFGHDTSELSDEEVEEGVERISEGLRISGVTLDEAADNISEFQRIMRRD